MRRSTIALIAGAIMLAGCPPLPEGPDGLGGGGGGGGSSGGELSSECQADFGASAAAAKLEGFMLATAQFTRAAAALEGSLKDSCIAMGNELGMSSGELSGDVRTVCNAVGVKLREEMSDLSASASLRIEVAATPPRCEISMEAYAGCTAECDIEVDPGEVPQCEGGEIRGSCSAQCQGSCTVEVQGSCSGSCQGSCEGGCQGVCNGVCEGECSSRNAEGQCNGTCSGTCHGSCSASCQGSCEGECTVSGQASCQGSCSGGCSVEYTEPVCTGEWRAPSVSAECQASCEARLEANVECTPGHTEIVITGEINENIRERVERVRGALRAGYGQLRVIGEKLNRIRRTGRALIDAAGNLRGTGRALGLNAVSCVTEAAAIIPNAVAQIGVSVQVQVEVSASVTASSGGQG